MLVGGPGVFWDGAFNEEFVADFHVVDVCGHGAVGVVFDYEGQVAFLICSIKHDKSYHGQLACFPRDLVHSTKLTLVRNRRIRPDNRLLAFLLKLRDNRTGNVQSARLAWVIKLEVKLLGVVVDILHLLQHKRDEALLATHESFGICGSRDGGAALRVLGGWVGTGVLCGGGHGDLRSLSLDIGIVAE